MNKVIQGDCLEKLKELEDNSVDSIVTDPPYELGFMGKSWDNTGIANNKEMWSECLRVLKPGGHLLAFSGTRTYHRMACAIEDAGFEVRDMIEWVYGSGFPKSLNIGKAVDKLQGNEREEFENKNGSATGSIVTTGTGNLKRVFMDSKGTSAWEGWGTALKPAHEPVIVSMKPLQVEQIFAILIDNIWKHLPASDAINNLRDTQATLNEVVNSVPENVRINFLGNIDNVEFVETLTTSLATKSKKEKENSAQENVAQSGEKLSQEIKTHTGEVEDVSLVDISTSVQMGDISENIVLLWKNLSEELLNQTNTLTTRMAIKKIIELKTLRSCLIQNTGISTGHSTKIPPNHEPICMARKPLAEKTVAENVLKYGTGGINIEESRVEIVEGDDIGAKNPHTIRKTYEGVACMNVGENGEPYDFSKGRFPANLIHDNSKEVKECFPEQKSGARSSKHEIGNEDGEMFNHGIYGKYKAKNYDDAPAESGNASRFFKGIPQVVDLHDFSIYNRSILTNIKQLCGQHLTKKRIGIMLDGVIQEVEKFIQDAELLMSGNNATTEKFLTDIASITKILIAQMTELKTLNVLPNWLIIKFTEESEQTIKSLKELNTEDVKSAKSIFLLQTFINEVLESIKAIAEIVVEKDLNNGEYKSLVYIPKASKSERNKGMDDLELKEWKQENSPNPNREERPFLPVKNNHPTVKPIALMEYLIKMVTPKGGTVLDPFAGSGSTLVACKQNGFQYIGIEKELEYIKIIEARLKK